jgi:hypothetical protein
MAADNRLNLYVRLQYIQDIQVNSLNVAFAATPDVPARYRILTAIRARLGVQKLI